MSAEAGFYTDFGRVPPIYFRRLFGSLPSRCSNLSALLAALDIVLLFWFGLLLNVEDYQFGDVDGSWSEMWFVWCLYRGNL